MSYMPETVNRLIQSRNDARSYGSNSSTQRAKTESFMDILATTKDAQQSSSKEVTKKDTEQTSSSGKEQPKADETAKEQGAKESTQKGEKEKTEEAQNSANEANQAGEVDAAAAALLAGAVFIPPVVTQEAAAAPVKAATTGDVVETVLNILPEEAQVNGQDQKVLPEAVQAVNEMPEEAAEMKTNQAASSVVTEQEAEGKEQQEDVVAVKKEVVEPTVKEETTMLKEPAMQKEEQPKHAVSPAPVQTAPVEEADAATVKVNDSSSILQRQVAQQVTDQIVSSIQDKQQQFTMSLHPERLGQVNVKMLFEGGKVMVQVETNSSLAQHLLTAGVTELKTLLENNGLQVDSVLVEQYLGQGQRDAEHSRNQSQQEKGTASQIMQENEEEAIDEIISETVLHSSGLNYSI